MVSPVSLARRSWGRRTFQVYAAIWILFDCLQIVFFVVLIAKLDDISVGIESRRIALEYGSVVACVLDALRGVNLRQMRRGRARR